MDVGRYVTAGACVGCPDVIEICHDGAAIAFFGDEPSLRYDDVESLLARYRLGAQDLRPASLRAARRSSRPPRA